MVEIGDALLDEHALVLELPQGVIADTAVDGTEDVDIVHFLDAHAAAAGRGLDQHERPPDALLLLEFKDAAGDAFGFHLVIDGPVGTGHGGHAQTARQALGVDLVAQFPDDLPRGADEDHLAVALHDPAGKAEVFGKEAVARMHGGAARLVRHGHELIGVMVGGDAVKAFFPAGLAGKPHMAGRGVLRGIDGREGHSQLAAGPHDAHGDFAAIGHKDFVAFQRHGIEIL